MDSKSSKPGCSRADLHVHTTYSDGTATPEDVLNYYALHSACSVVAITDHDTLDGAIRARRHAEEHADLYGHLDLIVGEEVSSKQGHILGLFLKEWIPPGMDAATTVDAIHAQGGVAIAAHPYTSWMRWAGLVGVGDLIRELPFDAVETRNSNFTEVFANRKAARRVRGAAQVGSSDGHFHEAVGRCYTEFPGTTADDLRRAIAERTTAPGGSCYGALTLAKYIWGRLRRGAHIFPRRGDFKLDAAEGALEISVRGSHAAAEVELRGPVDGPSMPKLKATLTCLARAGSSVVVDLSGVSHLDSVGVTALVAGVRSAHEARVGFCVAAAPSHCVWAMESAGLLRVCPREATVKAARACLAQRVPDMPGSVPEVEKEVVLQ